MLSSIARARLSRACTTVLTHPIHADTGGLVTASPSKPRPPSIEQARHRPWCAPLRLCASFSELCREGVSSSGRVATSHATPAHIASTHYPPSVPAGLISDQTRQGSAPSRGSGRVLTWTWIIQQQGEGGAPRPSWSETVPAGSVGHSTVLGKYGVTMQASHTSPIWGPKGRAGRCSQVRLRGQCAGPVDV